MILRGTIVWVLVLAGVVAGLAPAARAASPSSASAPAAGKGIGELLPNVATPGGAGTTIQWIVLVTVLSLAPAVLVMVTCFTRIVVVLGLLRQALATQQIPPNQVLFGLAVLMTVVVMAPVYRQVHSQAVSPYLAGTVSRDEALAAGEKPLRDFMIRQIEAGGNSDDAYLFLDEATAQRDDLTWRDVPTLSLIPAFVVSELKIAFYMGFRIYLPFLVIDMLVGAVLISMGMLMLPPVLISLPFKLLLFVLADGWHLVVGTLMSSFG